MRDAQHHGADAPHLAAPARLQDKHPGVAAPPAAHRLPEPDVAPTKDKAAGGSGDAGNQVQGRGNFATVANTDKDFHTLRAKLALKGHTLSRTNDQDGPVLFHVNRWGMVRELRDLAAVRDFAEQVGAR